MSSETKELLEFLLDRYQEKDLGAPGEEPRGAPLDELDATLATEEERMAARVGIKHFLDASRQFLIDHPPQTHVMLAQGFGVSLAGGYEVCLVPPMIDGELPGSLEHTTVIPITVGRSIRGQGGVTATDAVAVTGARQEPSIRNPGG